MYHVYDDFNWNCFACQYYINLLLICSRRSRLDLGYPSQLFCLFSASARFFLCTKCHDAHLVCLNRTNFLPGCRSNTSCDKPVPFKLEIRDKLLPLDNEIVTRKNYFRKHTPYKTEESDIHHCQSTSGRISFVLRVRG